MAALAGTQLAPAASAHAQPPTPTPAAGAPKILLAPGDRGRRHQEAREELRCIAAAGGGVYRDATDAESLRQELRVLSTRALREYIVRGKEIKGGQSARQATLLTPGQYTDRVLPDSERWYAVDLKRGETLKASQSLIPPDRGLGDGIGAGLEFDIVTPSFDIPAEQNSSAGNADLFERRGFVQGIGVVSRPIGVGEQAAADAPFSKPGRYYLKLTFEDTTDKELYNATGGRPYTSEMSIEVLGRGRDEKPPARQAVEPTTPEEPPSAALPAGVGGALAVLAGAGGALTLGRRRA